MTSETEIDIKEVNQQLSLTNSDSTNSIAPSTNQTTLTNSTYSNILNNPQIYRTNLERTIHL